MSDKRDEITVVTARKLAAEADKFEAEADKAEAEAEAARADARRALAEARKLEGEADVQEVSRDMAFYDRKKWQAGDEFHHTYNFTSSVNDKSVWHCMAVLELWDRLDPKCEMSIIFTSPGGGLIHGLALFDFIKIMERKGHIIETGALGWAASMAGILLQAGTKRWMSKESWLLIHEASFQASGKLSEVEDEAAWMKKVSSRILDIFSNRAAQATHKSPESIRRWMKKAWERKDWWLTSDEALRHGFVDEVR